MASRSYHSCLLPGTLREATGIPLGCSSVFLPECLWYDAASTVGLARGSFLRTHSIESVVQFLLFERFIKTSSSKKVGNKNDNSSKVACHIVALLYIKKVISRFAGCSRWQSSGYWLCEGAVIAATRAKLTERVT